MESWALVVPSVVLACLTAWYAWETRRIVKRMDKEREEMSRPILTLQIVPWQANALKLRIQNVGNGAAIGVEGAIETETKSGVASVPWSYPLLGPDKYEEFGFPLPPGGSDNDRFSFNAIKEKVVEVRAKFTYKSVSGAKYQLQAEVPIEKVTKDWEDSRMLVTQDHPERIPPRIAAALEDVAKKLGELVQKNSS